MDLQCYQLNRPCLWSPIPIDIVEDSQDVGPRIQNAATSRALTAAGFKRVRAAAACDACKARKDRCTTLSDDEQCEACRLRGRSCVYTSTRKRKAARLQSPSALTTSGEIMPSRPSILRPLVVDALGVQAISPSLTISAGQQLLNDAASTSYVMSLLSNYFESCHQGLFYRYVCTISYAPD